MPRLHGFQKKELLEIYRKMVLARRLDEKQLIMLKQGRPFFISVVLDMKQLKWRLR